MAGLLRFLYGKSRKPSEPEIEKPVPPPGRNQSQSALLRDILSAGEPEARGPAGPIGRVALSQKLAVGTRLAKSRSAAIDLARELKDFADEKTAALLGDLAGALERSAFKIAFAGQVKAGKSSLINVLVEQPELLPSDINPWTSVITRLHFGIPGEPKSGAAFTFFAPGEWARLSAGGKTRELTDRAFPDFNWEALKLQVETLKARAAAKIGPRFEELLGTVHSYPATDVKLLNRYVGAGNIDGLSEEDRAGEFSDITKTADLFFDLAAFDFPAIVIDTPGVNDPFLIRDEITRQNLEDADICVAVLTARQPLSDADLGLLRVLKGLRKDRLIVFINKADELEGGAGIEGGLIRQVSAVLQREFPASDIQLILGSAAWANQALGKAGSGAAEPAFAFLEAGGGFLPEVSDLLESPSSKSNELLDRSGLPSLAVAISDAMERGEIAAAVNTVQALASSAGRNLLKWIETEARILALLQESAGSVQDEVQKIAAMKDRLIEVFNRHTEEAAALRDSAAAGFRDALSRAAAEITQESPQLGEGFSLAAENSLKLRGKLESAYMKAFEREHEASLEAVNRLRISAAKIMMDAGFDPDAVMQVGHHFVPLPAPHAIDELTAQTMAKDFAPAVETLAEDGSGVLQREWESILDGIIAVTLGPLDSVLDNIAPWAANASTAPGEEALARHIEDLRNRAAGLKIMLARDGSGD
jgi:GTP-binding protein EngB required for normal cell division